MCPVCRARFRGTSECSRCGADLKPIMYLQAEAWRLRQTAREAVIAGDFSRAFGLATRAETVCHTPAGRGLKVISGWLVKESKQDWVNG